jgi:hypothetical protein
MGWNSWDCFATTVTEAQTRAHADLMAEKLARFGYNIVTVDIQWYEPNATGFDYRQGAKLDMDGFGRLIPAANKFPSAAVPVKLSELDLSGACRIRDLWQKKDLDPVSGEFAPIINARAPDASSAG